MTGGLVLEEPSVLTLTGEDIPVSVFLGKVRNAEVSSILESLETDVLVIFVVLKEVILDVKITDNTTECVNVDYLCVDGCER